MKKFKESYFVKTLGLVKKNPKNVFLIILFDILFIAAIIFASFIATFFMPKLSIGISATIVISSLILVVLYCLALVLIYSFFKYLVLNHIKKTFKKSKTDLKTRKNGAFFVSQKSTISVRLSKFYLFNLSTIAVFLITFLILNGVFLTGAKQEYASYIFLIINVPLFSLLYIFINISHTLFSESEESIIKNTFNLLGKIKNYIGIFLINIIAIIIYFIIFYFIWLILKNTLFKGYLASIQYYNIYTIIFTVITTVFFYLIIFFNRIYFYNIIINKK